MMTDARVMSIGELKAFLASSDVLRSRETLGKRPTRGSSIPYVPTATSLAPGQRKDMRSYISHFPPVGVAFQHFLDPWNQPWHGRLSVVVHRACLCSFSVFLCCNLSPPRLNLANSIVSSTHFPVSSRNLR